MIDPRTVALFIPPGLKKFKLDLFERIGRKIAAAGGQVVRHEYDLIGKLPDEVVPIVGCTPQFRDLVLHDWPARKRNFIYWDRGYLRRVFATWLPRGDNGGFYRWSRNCFQMQAIDDVPDDRWKALKIESEVKPWRSSGRHIVVAHTGFDYWDLFSDRHWTERTVEELKRYTDRPIKVRDKESTIPLGVELQGAHALVTHGSIAAVEAVVMGCPVFVHEFSTARLVGKTDFSEIENPAMPDRIRWLWSLAYHQFNESELVDGTLWRLIK